MLPKGFFGFFMPVVLLNVALIVAASCFMFNMCCSAAVNTVVLSLRVSSIHCKSMRSELDVSGLCFKGMN